MLEQDYTLAEVAAALRLSPRKVRQMVYDGAECMRSDGDKKGSRITFTSRQVELLRASLTKTPIKESVTTGRKKAS